MIRCLWALSTVVFIVPFVRAGDRDADEQILRDAHIETDGPTLLAYFKNRINNSADRNKIASLIKKLGDDDFEVREKATADLIAIGSRAEGQLRDTVRDTRDAEVKRRAEDCLRQLSKGANLAVIAAAARVLADRRPEGTAAILLEYLAEVPAESVVNAAVSSALEGVAVKDGKADPVVVKALEDKLAVRRAAAGVALIRGDARDQMPAVRKLLQDLDSKVRLRVAVALVFAKDKEAVPALIELLADLPAHDGYEVEEILRTLAGDAAPDVPLGKDADERKKARDAWAAWWKKGSDKVDFAKLAEGISSGRTLLVVRDAVAGKPTYGRVMEIGRDGKTRWQLDKLQAPIDAQLLPGGRVLILEIRGRLTERTTKGEIVWDKTLTVTVAAGAIGSPIGAQRLADGNTFVATRAGAQEIDKDGKEVWSYRSTAGSITAARKSRTGEVALITLNGTCIRLDAKGKEVGTFAAVRVPAGGNIDILANGHVLVPDSIGGKVREYDDKGKVVWEANVERPSSAVRLPNGRTLVSSPFAKRIVELDGNGKEVWKCELDVRPYRAYRR